MAPGWPNNKLQELRLQFCTLQLISWPRSFRMNITFYFLPALCAIVSNVNIPLTNNTKPWYSNPTCHSRLQSRGARAPSPSVPSEPVEQPLDWPLCNGLSRTRLLTDRGWNETWLISSHICWSCLWSRASREHENCPHRTTKEWTTCHTRRGGRNSGTCRTTIETLVLKTLSTSQNDIYILVSAALETSVLRTVRKAVNLPEFMSRFSDTIVDKPDSSLWWWHSSHQNNGN